MKLQPKPFACIEQGTKTIELRLYDEKRKAIRIGDIIRFRNMADETKEIAVKVIGLHRFETFSELYRAFPKERMGYAPSETASPLDMEQYYSAEEQANHGVIGIEIQKI